MRIIKQRLQEMVPGIKVFLDVDDMNEGRGAEYVDVSKMVLVFVSEGYFSSPSCMNELLRALATNTPIITLMEDEGRPGRLDEDQVRDALVAADEGLYQKWQLPEDMKAWMEGPTSEKTVGFKDTVKKWDICQRIADDEPVAEMIMTQLFHTAQPPIEWNRLGAYQDVTMRLIATRLLPDAGELYLDGELTRQREKLVREAQGQTYYCSVYNDGAAELAKEAGLRFDDDALHRPQCDGMLLYLTGLTWSAKNAQSLQEDVEFFLDRDPKKNVILLAHEMPGVGQEGRHAVNFDFLIHRGPPKTKAMTPDEKVEHLEKELLRARQQQGTAPAPSPSASSTATQSRRTSCPSSRGQPSSNRRTSAPTELGVLGTYKPTPKSLMKKKVYRSIAVALKGGEWRPTSMALLAEEAAKLGAKQASWWSWCTSCCANLFNGFGGTQNDQDLDDDLNPMMSRGGRTRVVPPSVRAPPSMHAPSMRFVSEGVEEPTPAPVGAGFASRFAAPHKMLVDVVSRQLKSLRSRKAEGLIVAEGADSAQHGRAVELHDIQKGSPRSGRV